MKEEVVIIVGSGPSGLATSACLNLLSIPNIVLEREDCFASLWKKKSYDRLHLHLPKQFCELPHMSFPIASPTYVPKKQFIQYLDDYASQFKVSPMYCRSVESATYDEVTKKWCVKARNTTSDEVEEYMARFLVVASGETSDAFVPKVEGLDTFSGEVLHSTQYISGEKFKSKNVLVVGCGNSGMEIALDLSNFGAKTSIVVRGPLHMLSREMVYMGLVLLKYLPYYMVDSLLIMLSKLVYGDMAKYGIPRPQEGPFSLKVRCGKYPVVDVGTYKKIKSGEIQVLPSIISIRGDDVLFANGRSDPFDVIVFATGFKRSSNKWLKDDDYLLNEDGIPKQSFPNHWKGRKGLYCAGLARRGLASDMDRVRPVYVREKSISGTSESPSSPMISPMHRHVRSGSTGVANFRKTQNYAAKAAAQRLAQVMAHQPAEEDDEDDLSFDYNSSNATGSIGLAAGRAMKCRYPALGRISVEQPPPARSTAAGQSYLSVNSAEQPSSARSTSSGRSYISVNSTEQPPSARSSSTGRPSLSVKTVPVVPPSVPISLRPPSVPPAELPADHRRDRRLSVDLGNLNIGETGNQRSTLALQDELRLAEEKCEEAEVRVRQLEKQVATLGEGVSLEARLLSRQALEFRSVAFLTMFPYASFLMFVSLFRKEAALQQKEAALKAAAQTHGGRNEEIASLRLEAEAARDEATSALEQLHEAECEIKSLRTMSQRMILTQEDMEEMVLKRCWLSRYWSLCVRHGIHAEIAVEKYQYWSSLAPLPHEVVLSAGQKAKEEKSLDNTDIEERDKVPRDMNELSGDGNIESMLLVEKGLRELASLKVEDAVVLAMAQHRRPNLLKSDDVKLPIEGQNLVEAFDLSQEESEEVLFKQAWLAYFWRRAKNHGVEQDIADERLQFWINHNTRSPTSHDAVDVERGLAELRKLGIETKLWEESRKWLDQDSIHPEMQFDSEF
ncbi:hypothetical protein HHK36_020712 [Tetracentron sinense]|uniref:Flavin-containing monooxygenase n=1 Tax=Tetracentron sinense TaxID=13715 RepID=A0A835DBA6_TETSI|nr:hypothetical protein HHK36_020712 [Tetracentron sinense]